MISYQVSWNSSKTSSRTVSLSFAIGPLTVAIPWAVVTEICHGWCDQAPAIASH